VDGNNNKLRKMSGKLKGRSKMSSIEEILEVSEE
jgi:hypothetical protein